MFIIDKKNIALYLLFCLGSFCLGQVVFESKISKNQVAVGEEFQFLAVLTASNKGSISEIEITGGKGLTIFQNSVSSRVNMVITEISKLYGMTASVPGNYTLIATAIVDGKHYKTKPRTIKVIGVSKSASVPVPAQSIISEENTESPKFIISTQNLTPYEGQDVLVTLRVLFKNKIQASRLATDGLDGFNVREVEGKNTTVTKELYKGTVYNSAIIKQLIVTPKKAGQLIINPIILYAPHTLRSRDFFGDVTNMTVMTEIPSNRLVFNVKPLPITGKPADFSGAVGNYELVVKADKTKVKAAEKIKAKVELISKGNLKELLLPSLTMDPAFEVYQEGNAQNIDEKQGKLIADYTLVPLYKGRYEIPSLSFSYFNPESEQYVTKRSSSIPITITTGDERPKDLENLDSLKQKSLAASDVILDDTALSFKHVKESFDFDNQEDDEKEAGWFIAGTIILAAVGVLGLKITKKRKKNKSKSASKILKKDIEMAQKSLKTNDSISFYTAIENMIAQHLLTKYHVERKDFSVEKIRKKLIEKNVDPTQVEQIIKVIENCMIQKYAPVQTADLQQTILQQTLKLIA